MRGFRAWHTQLSRYLKDNEFYIDSNGSVYSAFESYDDKIRKTDYVENFSRDDFDEGYIILEDYTGLKDKNCKEIYEGDIVSVRNKNRKNEYDIGAVEFGKAAFRCPFLLGKYHSGQVEVIGNIHENHDLLGEK